MADNLIQSTQFSINQLAVYTKSGELLDISSSFGQLHLFDSIFVPVMNGFIGNVWASNLKNQKRNEEESPNLRQRMLAKMSMKNLHQN